MNDVDPEEQQTGTRPSEADGAEEALTVPLQYTPRHKATVLELDMSDGVILYDDTASLVHHLNPSAAVIWQICDGSGTVGELARDLAEEYGLDIDLIREQVAQVVAEFDALGLVENGADLDGDLRRES
jgi:PqqD family protein of HPr-rel-A system